MNLYEDSKENNKIGPFANIFEIMPMGVSHGFVILYIEWANQKKTKKNNLIIETNRINSQQIENNTPKSIESGSNWI